MTTYSASQVAKAAGMSVSAFGMQFTRDHWRLFSNERPENGKAHQFTLAQVIVYALARKLQEIGFAPADAFSVAIFGLDQTSVDKYFGREGSLFDQTQGRTFFIAFHRDGNNAPYGRWFTSKENSSLEALFALESAGTGKSRKEQVVVVDLTALRDRVLAELGETETA